MKKVLVLLRYTSLLLLLLLVASCGSDGGKFSLQGRLRNMNQGEFWVYSPDGGIVGFDTITVRSGRFSYEVELRNPSTLVIIFPNYSEQPVFAEPGEEVSIKGDATHLKEMIIEGTDDNEIMTELRMELNQTSPPDIHKVVGAFIKENPSSIASIYLLKHYFILNRTPDYVEASKLTNLLLKHHPEKGQLIQLQKQLKGLQKGKVKSKLPKFTAKDLKGRKVTEKNLKGKVNVVSLWASWNFRSTDMQRRLKALKKKYGDNLGVVSICIDGSPKDCERRIARDSLKWSTVCDGKMWGSPLLSQFGMADVPSNIITDEKGTIVERNLQPEKLEEQINQLMLKYKVNSLLK